MSAQRRFLLRAGLVGLLSTVGASCVHAPLRTSPRDEPAAARRARPAAVRAPSSPKLAARQVPASAAAPTGATGPKGATGPTGAVGPPGTAEQPIEPLEFDERLQDDGAKLVQQQLVAQKYLPGSHVTGSLDDETRAALRAFQAARHLEPSGQVTQATVRQLGLAVVDVLRPSLAAGRASPPRPR